MTETFVAIGAMMVALFMAVGASVGIMAALAGWRDWRRERASWNCEPGRSHRLEGTPKLPL